jgi:hypothetical protein
MATITFSLEELLEVLISNKLLPSEIIRAKVQGQRIHFIIRTNLLILPYIPASLRFFSFDDNNAIFELTIVSKHLYRVMKRLESSFLRKMPAYVKFEYPKIFVDVENFLKEKNIRGIRVKDIFFKQGRFTIDTAKI